MACCGSSVLRGVKVTAGQASYKHGHEWALNWCFLSNLDPLTKFSINNRKTEFKKIFPLKDLSNDHKDHSNQPKDNQKLCDEKEHSLYNFCGRSFVIMLEFTSPISSTTIG